MKKVLAGAMITLASVLVYKSCADQKNDGKILRESTMLIQERLQQVSKLIVTEGHFSEVYTYADSKEILGNLITADKRALVVVNAEVAISYDLKKMEYAIDQTTKTLQIREIPEPQIHIHPEFEYYEVSADYLNPFKAADYNVIDERVRNSLLQKIKSSNLVSNAENRLLSELSSLLVLTRNMGWTLVYKKGVVTKERDFKI